MKWPILGGIRFLLALIVAASHLTWFIKPLPLVCELQHFSGLAAVLSFLAISGYSIAASYAKEKTGFYRRRALRILPLYYLSVVASALIPHLFGGYISVPIGMVFGPLPLRHVVCNLAFLQGFLVGSLVNNPIVWTLSIEAFFYLLTPLVARLSPPAILVSIFALSLVYAFTRGEYYGLLRHGAGVVLLGWVWLLGFWMYSVREKKATVGVALVLGLAAVGYNGQYLKTLWPITWTVTILAIGYAGAIPHHRYAAKALDVLGVASYPLYLFHIPVFLILSGLKFSQSGVMYLSSAILVSLALNFWFDKPIKRLVNRYQQRDAAEVSTVSPKA